MARRSQKKHNLKNANVKPEIEAFQSKKMRIKNAF